MGRAAIPANVRVASISIDKLPTNWFAALAPIQLQMLGGEWLASGDIAMLKVPSAIVTEEWNYLINPLHTEFRKLRISAPKSFNVDQRVARSRKR